MEASDAVTVDKSARSPWKCVTRLLLTAHNAASPHHKKILFSSFGIYCVRLPLVPIPFRLKLRPE